MEKLINYAKDNKENFLSDLVEILKIASVSNNPDFQKDMNECAKWIENKFNEIGLNNIKIYETEGHPIVYGDWLKAGADKPTILIYGHYDVQPTDPIELWETPPFEPTIRNNKIYARGANDDKGQIMIHIKSIETYMKTVGKLPINIKFILEGEEEIGSKHLGKFIKEHYDLLKCDYIVISDTSMYDENMPSICYGLRGITYMQIDITGPVNDLHSGSYGGGVDNPVNVLATIISKLKNEKGKILIDGFYDDVIPISEKEHKEFNRLPFNEGKFKQELKISELYGEESYTMVERMTSRPTLDCNGIWGGYQGDGTKTIIPSKAGVKISMRLVPEQDPDNIAKLFTDYVKKISPNTVKVEVSALHGGKPYSASLDSPAIKAAIVSLKKAYGVEPVYTKEGGSIPIVNTFKEILGADTLLLGFALPNENAHGPNESFDLNNYYKGINTVLYFINELSK